MQPIADNSMESMVCMIMTYMRVIELDRHAYRQVSNISCSLVGNYIVDHSDVVGASPVGAAPTTSSLPT